MYPVLPTMSKIKRSDPQGWDDLRNMIEASRRMKQPVILTDNMCSAKNFSCRNQSEVNVVDLTSLEHKPEVERVIMREHQKRQLEKEKRRDPGKVYPCDLYEAAPTEEDLKEDSCSCFGGKKPSARQQKIMDGLQRSVGDDIEIKLVKFKNWGLVQEAIVFAAHPRTKLDIVKLIIAAKENKIRIRSVGSRHSWSRIHADDHYLVLYMDQMESDYAGGANIRLNKEDSTQADVMVGVTTGDFKDFQVKNGLHLPANVILQTVTIVGVVAVGCHGVGWDVNTPGDYITQMRIFDSEGNLRVYTDEDKDMMLAISANFGCFGIIYDVTIQLHPPRKVSVVNKYMPFKTIMKDEAAFRRLVEDNWSIELFWFPYNSRSLFSNYDPMEDELYIRIINDDDSGAPMTGQDFYEDQERLDYIGHEALLVTSVLFRNFPDLTPLLSDAGFSVLQQVYPDDVVLHQPLPEAIHYRKHIHLSPVRDMEFMFDFNKDYKKMMKVIQLAIDTNTAFNQRGKYPLNIALEMRWMAYGESYMTPATTGNPKHGGSGHVFYIEVLSVSDTPHWEEYCVELANKWMKLGGLPHLAKEWQYIPGINSHINKKMGKLISQFKKQLQKSKADPTGMFLTPSLCKLMNM